MNLPKKSSKLYKDILPLSEPLVCGVVLVIDPSIGSSSSSPGVALYEQGELVFATEINTGGSHLPLWRRARELGLQLSALCAKHHPDVLVFEDIPATSGYNQNAVASLLKAVGVTLACTTSDHVLGVHPTSWKGCVRDEYVKGDANDAKEIGVIVIETAKNILAR